MPQRKHHPQTESGSVHHSFMRIRCDAQTDPRRKDAIHRRAFSMRNKVNAICAHPPVRLQTEKKKQSKRIKKEALRRKKNEQAISKRHTFGKLKGGSPIYGVKAGINLRLPAPSRNRVPSSLRARACYFSLIASHNLRKHETCIHSRWRRLRTDPRCASNLTLPLFFQFRKTPQPVSRRVRNLPSRWKSKPPPLLPLIRECDPLFTAERKHDISMLRHGNIDDS